MRGRLCRNDYRNHKEGHEGGVEGRMRQGRQDFAITVKQERKRVDDLISHENVPRFVRAADMSQQKLSYFAVQDHHNSG